MSDVIYHRTTCRMCGSQDFNLALKLAPSPIGDEFLMKADLSKVQHVYPIDLFMCKRCGLAQLLDVISPDILYGNYIYVTESSPGLREHFRNYANEACDEIKPSHKSLAVDIGSNDGSLLRHFRDNGMNVLGIEPASKIAEQATQQGVETISDYFTPSLAKKIRQKYSPATIITANNVFANIDDVTSVAEGVRELLAPDGVFVMESFYLADLVKNMVFDFIYHEHLSAFSVRPVKAFYERMGLELIDVKRVPTKGGSLRYIAQLKNGPRKVSESVGRLIKEENDTGLYLQGTFERFARKIDALKTDTCKALAEIKKTGKIIAGFGASITGTTLIYHFGIGQHLDYLVDDNVAKQGRFSPGLHIPVYPSRAILEKKPDFVVVLAWRFSDMIINSNREYLDAGGRFIVPVPKMKVI